VSVVLFVEFVLMLRHTDTPTAFPRVIPRRTAVRLMTHFLMNLRLQDADTASKAKA